MLNGQWSPNSSACEAIFELDLHKCMNQEMSKNTRFTQMDKLRNEFLHKREQ